MAVFWIFLLLANVTVGYDSQLVYFRCSATEPVLLVHLTQPTPATACPRSRPHTVTLFSPCTRNFHGHRQQSLHIPRTDVYNAWAVLCSDFTCIKACHKPSPYMVCPHLSVIYNVNSIDSFAPNSTCRLWAEQCSVWYFSKGLVNWKVTHF